MNDIRHDFLVTAPPRRVFEALSTPDGLDSWWTRTSSGRPAAGADWELGFGDGYQWAARVVRCEPDRAFELEMTRANEDWEGTRVGFELVPGEEGTVVRFHHVGWAAPDDHFRTSSYCWAMYLRLLKRSVETGEVVPYESRLAA